MRLLSMSGFIPEHICDTVRFTHFPGDFRIQHYCGYASDFLSQVMQDNSIDGAVFPRSCDSTRIMAGYLEETGKFIYQMNIPSRQDELAVDYFAASIRNYKQQVEAYFSVNLRDIETRIETVNQRNQDLKKLYHEIGTISYKEYLEAIHEMLQRPLYEQKVPSGTGQRGGTGKRIFLIGSFLSDLSVLETLEKNGLTVVGDTLPESGRIVSAPVVNQDGDLYHAVARSILGMRLSPTQNNFREILEADLMEIKAKNVQGVVFITQKYCEPYDYLFSVYKKKLDELGIPVLKISLHYTTDDSKATLAIEAFADMLQ